MLTAFYDMILTKRYQNQIHHNCSAENYIVSGEILFSPVKVRKKKKKKKDRNEEDYSRPWLCITIRGVTINLVNKAM